VGALFVRPTSENHAAADIGALIVRPSVQRMEGSAAAFSPFEAVE